MRLSLLLLFASCTATARAESRVFPAPPAEYRSAAFKVAVDGHDSPVYLAKVGPADDARRSEAMDNLARSGEIFDPAAFSIFEVAGSTDVVVSSPDEIRSVKVLPASAGIKPTIDGKAVRFSFAKPANLTVEINGDSVRSLHLFANPLDAHPPAANDPNVIYFGPGVHEVEAGIDVTSRKTVYLAGGAILRAVVPSGAAKVDPVLKVHGSHIVIRGSGIIDGGNCPMHSRYLMLIGGSDITLEGVTLNDAPGWNMPIRASDGVRVKNLKIIGHRRNSDGIDICNSSNVTVDGCFIRTLDDLVVVKTDELRGPSHHIVVRGCVLWNEVAHALSVGAELRENVDDVLFADCDIIHDTGREWTLRVFHSDAAVVSNIRFEHLRIDQSRRLISLWIGKTEWTHDPERGHIKKVTFEDIVAVGAPLTIQLQGYDAGHRIEGVAFKSVQIAGRPLEAKNVKRNAFTEDVSITP